MGDVVGAYLFTPHTGDVVGAYQFTPHTGDVAIFARHGRPGRLAAQPRWSFIDWKFIQPRKHEMSNLNYWTRKRSATA